MEILLLLAALCALGVVAGFMAGLLGVGGGIVLVPGLYAIFSALGYNSENLIYVCVGTSLSVIVVTGFSSARAHWRKGAVEMDLVKRIGVGIFAGVITGTLAAIPLGSRFMELFFTGAIVVLAVIMISNPARFSFIKQEPGQPWSAMAGLVIGFVSSLVGIGGATLSVPYMSLCGVPIHRAVGTASALGLVISIPAALGFILIGLDAGGKPPFTLGFVNVAAWASIMPFSFLMAPVGAAAAHKAPVNLLRRIFALFMFVVAFKMGAEFLR